MEGRSACMFVASPFRHDARVMREATSLAEAGVPVRVVAQRLENLPAHEGDERIEVVRVDVEVTLTRLVTRAHWALRRPGRGPRAAASSPPEAQPAADSPAARALAADTGAAKGVRNRLYLVALRLHLAAVAAKYFRRAYAEAKRGPADIWVAHDLDTLPLAWWARRRLGGRLVYDSHELWVDRNAVPRYTRLGRWWWRALESRLAPRADRVITVNESLARELESRYGIGRPAIVRNVPSRADGAPPRPLREQLGVASEERVLLFLGGLTRNRGLKPLVASLEALERCVLVLVGPTTREYAGELMRTAAEHGVAERIHLVPPVPANEVVAYARGADVGLAPIQNAGLSYYYSLPNKLFEYLAAGLPVVASDFPELRAVIRGEDVGETCDPDDPADIARAVRAVTDDPERFEQLRSNARQAGRRHTWEAESEVFLRACLR